MTAPRSRVQAAVRRAMRLRTPDKPEHGAYHVDYRSMLARVSAVMELSNPHSKVLCVGDDDLTSLCLARLGYRDITVVDFDRELLGIIDHESKGRVRGLRHDLRDVYAGKLPRLGSKFDLFLTDPPYGPDGLRIFSGVGLGALARGGHGLVVAPAARVAGSSVGNPDELALILQSFLLSNGGVLVSFLPKSQRSYHGTVSSLLVVRKVLKSRRVDFAALEGAGAFY